MDAIRASWRLAFAVESARRPIATDHAVDPNRAVINSRADQGERIARPVGASDGSARASSEGERGALRAKNRGASHGPEPPATDFAADRARERERWAEDMALRLSLAKLREPDGLFHGPPTFDWKVGSDGQPYPESPLTLDPRLSAAGAAVEAEAEGDEPAPPAADAEPEYELLPAQGGRDPPDVSPRAGPAGLAPGTTVDAWA